MATPDTPDRSRDVVGGAQWCRPACRQGCAGETEVGHVGPRRFQLPVRGREDPELAPEVGACWACNPRRRARRMTDPPSEALASERGPSRGPRYTPFAMYRADLASLSFEPKV